MDKIKELKEEIEELSIQLSDMLCVALRLSGVREDALQEALDSYIELIDEGCEEYGQEEILATLEKLKATKPKLFGVKE
ncbi:hypothetical protein [Helicobacter burdigaliensis]|uniref:hypothetical protein n=1 Tax=Helicobacter burdigaliensis TaxID=2315334 RepID=UPI000EF750FC|nr:hypothetical protein [Helicobacter burdigaliensis]